MVFKHLFTIHMLWKTQHISQLKYCAFITFTSVFIHSFPNLMRICTNITWNSLLGKLLISISLNKVSKMAEYKNYAQTRLHVLHHHRECEGRLSVSQPQALQCPCLPCSSDFLKSCRSPAVQFPDSLHEKGWIQFRGSWTMVVRRLEVTELKVALSF